MNILDLLEEIGLVAKRTACSHEGEYHSPCPSCAGNDRFCIWPNQGEFGRYWCRRCDRKGDGIQFCRDFLGMSFKEACNKLGAIKSIQYQNYKPKIFSFEPKNSFAPSIEWSNAALKFVQESHKNLLNTPFASEALFRRGLTLETIRKFQLGWNPLDKWELRKDWGLAEECKEGRYRKQWLPKGWVIPTFNEKHLPKKLKVRRENWSIEDDLPKYVEICGGQKQFSVFGNIKFPIVLVEAEFDAILVVQEALDICCSIAVGGAHKKPDKEIHHLLKSSSKILFSLDFDEAGRNAFSFWKKNYLNMIAWPVPEGKSPEEANNIGVGIYDWIREGLE